MAQCRRVDFKWLVQNMLDIIKKPCSADHKWLLKLPSHPKCTCRTKNGNGALGLGGFGVPGVGGRGWGEGWGDSAVVALYIPCFGLILCLVVTVLVPHNTFGVVQQFGWLRFIISDLCNTELLSVSLGFFMCQMYWSETEQLSVLYTETNVPWFSQITNRNLIGLLVDMFPDYSFYRKAASESSLIH